MFLPTHIYQDLMDFTLISFWMLLKMKKLHGYDNEQIHS